ncbi:MAG TPA: cation:proton antiporter [Bacteroidales bacterium]|nr:cation:proton antiporter [Bacteroidales bacterium]
MTNAIIIVLCSMLLLAYVAEISSERTRIPSIILLLLLGWIVRQVTGLLDWNIPDLDPLLPLLGTVGLILIVLEGSLDLQINRSKTGTIKITLLSAIISLITFSLVFTAIFCLVKDVNFITGLMNAVPLSVISSSIAIPAARHSAPEIREFVIYESSMSDVIGVLLFNFVAFNAGKGFNFGSASFLILQIVLIVLISSVSVLGLSALLSRIRNHISYTPIILLAILIYAVAKEFDLSGLLFIMVFGLFLGNVSEVRKIYPLEMLNPDRLETEILKFRSITVEATFFVRSLFFLLFGFLMETSDFLNIETLPMALIITGLIFGLRLLLLKLLNQPGNPLVYFSPRGLITILLFLSVLPAYTIPGINDSLIIQVIVLSVLIMAFGLIKHGRQKLN